MKKLIYLLAMSLWTLSISAQTDSQTGWISKHPLVICFGSNAHSLPFYKIIRTDIFNPAFSIGTEFSYLKRKHSEIYQSANLGGFYNKYSTRGMFINTDIAYRYTTNFGLFAGLGTGVGYLHAFHPAAIYEFDGADYQQKRDWGKPKIMIHLNLDLGYTFTKKNDFSVFVRYKPYYFQYREGVPAINTSLQLGCRFKII